MENIMQAGFHCVEVQPPLGLLIPGYYRRRPAEGTADPLHLRAVAFACGDEKAVFFNCEAIGMRADAYDIIKKKIAAACDISEDAVYLNCIHSHTSYVICQPGTELDNTDIHLHKLFQQFADCAKLAFNDLKPCTILTATGEAKGIAFVRRYRMKDGTARTNPPKGDPNIVGPIGTPDEQVRLIRIQREGAKEILMVHFGTHADMIGGNLFSPDWPGYLVNTLDRALDGEVHTMFLLGAEGDCATRYALPDRMPKGVAKAKAFARRVAGAVLRVYDLAEPAACDTLRVAHKYVQVGKNTYDPAKLPMVEELVKIYRERGEKDPELNKYPDLNYREALRIKANLARPEFYNLRISGVRLGDIAFIGIPGEPFASIGLDIVAKSTMPMTVVTACTNGYEGYYPDAQAYKEPGYSYEKATSPFAPDCAAKLIEGAMDVLEQLQ
ncbi:MAG: hypothetical protein E7437_09400 [Ruminococcaceae bacterium]|nr:hypothetical protein [Oscillospiraceae bacterium]